MSRRPPSAGAALLLIGRFLRSSGARRSATILTAAFAVLAALFIAVSAFTPTPGQQADQTFGRYQQRTYTGVGIGDLSPSTLSTAETALRSAVPGGAHVFLETDQLRPDSFAKLYVQAPIATTRFVEDPALRQAFPGRYSLERGVWPQSANDVVVSRHVFDALPDRTGFTTLSGRVRLRVVGVVRDSFDRHGDTIVAGPGTWETITPPPVGHQYQPVEAQVTVLFGPAARVADVARVLDRELPPLPRLLGERSEYVTGNQSTRAQALQVAAARFGTDQIVVSYLPLFLVVLLVSALVAAQNRTAHRAHAGRLVALGVGRRLVVGTRAAALVAMSAGSIVVGLGLGWLLGIVLRASVLGRLADQPLSPLPALTAPTLAIAGLCLVLIPTGTLWPAGTAPGGQVRRRGARVIDTVADLRPGILRRALVVTLVVLAVRAADGPTPVAASYLTVAAILLLGPDLLRLVLRLLPSRSARMVVSQRLMWVDRGRQGIAVVVVGACLAVPICAGTQLTSRKVSDASFTFSKIPEHQVWLQSSDTTPDVSGLATIVSRVEGIGAPVVVRGLIRPAGPRGEPASSARFLRTPRSRSYNSSVLVIGSAADLGRLVGGALPRSAEQALVDGGVVDFSGARGAQQFGISTDGAADRVTPTLPTAHVSLRREFSRGFGGAVLTTTARRLGLPISQPTQYIYPGASPRVIGAAVATAVENGYDSEFVQYAVPPPPPMLPVAGYVFLAGLVLGGFAVLLLVLIGQARRLRSYAARLISIGLGPRWTLSVLGVQAAVVVGVGGIVGIVGGVLGVLVTTSRYAVLDIPIGQIALACGATLAAAALATVLAGRALTAAEREDVA